MIYEATIEGVPVCTGDIICTADGVEAGILGQLWRALGYIVPGEIDHSTPGAEDSAGADAEYYRPVAGSDRRGAGRPRWLAHLAARRGPALLDGSTPEACRRIELTALAAVIQAERAPGFEPRDVSAEKVGYDVESRIPGTDWLRFIEVKGRAAGAMTVTVTRSEILVARNKPAAFVLDLVAVPLTHGGSTPVVRYVCRPFISNPER